MKILHLSDIHYGNDFIPWAISQGRGFWKRPSEEIVNGLTQAIRILGPDYVVISGDFVNKASSADFADAARFLRDLLANAGVVVRDQVFVVPGNHDVGFFKKNSDESKRLNKFRGFIRELYQDPNSEDRQSKFLRRFDRHRLIVLVLDTTLKSLRPRADGEIGMAQLNWAKQQLDELHKQMGVEFERYIKIAVMHHHCVPITGEHVSKERYMQLLDAGEIMTLLRKNGFDVVLHGHKHVPHVSPVYREDGGVLTVVGAGTALAPYSDQQGVFGNNFNVLHFKNSLEVAVTQYKASSNGEFTHQGNPSIYPVGKPVTEGYKTRKVRRLWRIADNGDMIATAERQGVLVTGANRIRKLPIRFSTDTPGAQITEFSLRKPDDCSIEWKIESEKMYDGFIVFPIDRTSQDGEISLIYDYTIKKGMFMSVAEKRARHPNSNDGLHEEGVLSLASHVDDLIIEFEFPRNYTVQPTVFFEKNGIEHVANAASDGYSLVHDEFSNTWKFSMANPPIRRGIIVRWKLPQSWQP
jgi:3',5'-cyclic AMP phosphodiesterase CpdA